MAEGFYSFVSRPKVRFEQSDMEKLENMNKNKQLPKIIQDVHLVAPLKLKLFKVKELEDNEPLEKETVEKKSQKTINNKRVTYSDEPPQVYNRVPLSNKNSERKVKSSSKINKTKSQIEVPCINLSGSSDEENKKVKPKARVCSKQKENVSSNNNKKNIIIPKVSLTFPERKSSLSVENKKTISTIMKEVPKLVKTNLNKPNSNVSNSQKPIKNVKGIMPCLRTKNDRKQYSTEKKIEKRSSKSLPLMTVRSKKLVSDNSPKKNISEEEIIQTEYELVVDRLEKLSEAKRVRSVGDIENLPIADKQSVAEKISQALDFPLEEVVYRNLIDLSIDDKQLPTPSMRSKDPEPRQPNEVPQLSDFMTLKEQEEYCEAASIKTEFFKCSVPELI